MENQKGKVLSYTTYGMNLLVRNVYKNKKVFYLIGTELKFYSGLLTQKNWPLKELFNYRILRLFETGELHQMELKFVKTPIDPRLNYFKEASPGLDFTDLVLGFTMLILLFVFSVLVLFFEQLKEKF